MINYVSYVNNKVHNPQVQPFALPRTLTEGKDERVKCDIEARSGTRQTFPLVGRAPRDESPTGNRAGTSAQPGLVLSSEFCVSRTADAQFVSAPAISQN